MKKNNNYIWLFGENLGKTSNNNSFYFWKHVVEIEDGIDKIYVMIKNKQNKKAYKTLSKEAKKNIIWKDSIKHHIMYGNADMLFVTLSYKDVEPTRRFIKRAIKTPIVYLQHGTLGIKKIGYQGNSYNNNMFRFFYYNNKIKNILASENKFKDYQLYYAEFHPRHKELITRYEKLKNIHDKKTKNILWFITWREYFGNNKETERFINNIKAVVNNYKIKEHLNKNNYKLKICLHQFFDKEKIDYIMNKLKNENIEIVTPDKIDVMDEVVKNDILITDYSSLAFDFTLLGKTVILYQPDIADYSKSRDFYYLEEMKKYAIKTPSKLAQELINGDMKVNQFFRNKLPENIDFDYIKKGKHIDKIYKEFSEIQKNEITFLGYNFYGKGGTISATLALAEGLLEKKYLVRLLSLKKHIRKRDFPYGLNVKALYFSNRKTIQYILKRLLFLSPRHYNYLKYDCNKEYLIPYVGYALKKKLKNIKSRTVISTRESLHLFLKETNAEKVKNKIYFFHTYYTVLQEQFVGLLDKLKEIRLENVAFITDSGRKQYLEKAKYEQYDNYQIVNNCLESSKMIKREEIQPIKKKNKYNSVYLLRISKDRLGDIENLFNFAKYIKKQKFTKLTIHVYGVGDYLDEFIERIEKEKLSKYIKYEGLAVNISKELKQYDFVTDFTLNHSFGMTYLEAIFNGKMVFGMKNLGSNEVLKEIPNCYINSFEDLLNKIKNIDKIKLEQLQQNYDIMYKKYSRKVITDNFVKCLK